MIIEQKITADITSDDVDIISLRSYFLAGLMSIEKYRQNIITTSFNRNGFNIFIERQRVHDR